MQNVRLALRQFRKSPGFAATVILTISLGIGANTAIFTLVHAILLKSLPVANPASLYRIGDLDDCCVNGGFINDNGDFDLFSYDLYRHFQDTTPEFEQLAAFQSGHNMMNVRARLRRREGGTRRIRLRQLLLDFRSRSLCRPHASARRRRPRRGPGRGSELPGLASRSTRAIPA